MAAVAATVVAVAVATRNAMTNLFTGTPLLIMVLVAGTVVAGIVSHYRQRSARRRSRASGHSTNVGDVQIDHDIRPSSHSHGSTGAGHGASSDWSGGHGSWGDSDGGGGDGGD